MKLKLYLYIVLIPCVLMMFSSCHRSALPPGVLPENQMVDLLTDVYIMEGYYADETMYHFDSMIVEINESYDELFDKYGITRAQFDSNMSYYSHNPAELELINQQVLSRLDSISPHQ